MTISWINTLLSSKEGECEPSYQETEEDFMENLAACYQPGTSTNTSIQKKLVTVLNNVFTNRLSEDKAKELLNFHRKICEDLRHW